MNLIAIDIGNTNINIALFLDSEQKSVTPIPGSSPEKISQTITRMWNRIPTLQSSREGKRDGAIAVSSVNTKWTKMVKDIVQELNENIYLIGKDIPYPMDLSVKEPEKIVSDRVVSAAAAYAVIESAVVIADLGTAVTIDLVDDRGVFVGGTISPGFDISSSALEKNTCLLKKTAVSRPKTPFGTTTKEAINCGLYYSAVGTLNEIIRRYAELLGTWPRTVITGAGAEIIKQDCEFIDSYVPDLVIKGIALSYQKYIEGRE